MQVSFLPILFLSRGFVALLSNSTEAKKVNKVTLEEKAETRPE